MADKLDNTKGNKSSGVGKDTISNLFSNVASTIKAGSDLYATSAEAVGSARVRATNAGAGYVPAGTLPNYTYGDQTQNPPIVSALSNIPPIYLIGGFGLLALLLLKKK